jgi:hypothetical protein
MRICSAKAIILIQIKDEYAIFGISYRRSPRADQSYPIYYLIL